MWLKSIKLMLKGIPRLLKMQVAMVVGSAWFSVNQWKNTNCAGNLATNGE